MALTQPLLHQVLYSGLLSLPIVIYINDCWFSIARVEGISMNPSLCDGDIVLVRKADFFPFFSTYRSSRIRVRDLTHEDELKQNQSIQVLQEVSDLQHALQVDKSIGKLPIHEMTWRKSPPMILPGDVVVFQNKYTFRPPELQIKRIIGIGGQNVCSQYYSPFCHYETFSIFTSWNHRLHHIGTIR
jgi:signal peptidase I